MHEMVITYHINQIEIDYTLPANALEDFFFREGF